MFTGIITHTGRITDRIEHPGGERTLGISAPLGPHPYVIGQSLACSGICLTITAVDSDGVSVTLSHETLGKTTAHAWDIGLMLNLEHPLCVSDMLGGHWVTGHVDAPVTIQRTRSIGDSREIVFVAEGKWAPYLCPKGSVTLDGVSLTLNDTGLNPDGTCWGSVHLIPHTLASTATPWHNAGQLINLEIDALARQVVHILKHQARFKTDEKSFI